MEIFDVMAILAGVFLLLVLIERVTKSTRLPLNVFLILAGFFGSEVALLFVHDLSIRWHHIRDIILYVLIPIIIFQTILKLDYRISAKEIWPTLLLAVPITLMTGLGIGFLLYWMVGHPEGFPLHSALVAGMLLATTSPATVGILLKQTKAPKRLINIMLGEGLFNGLIAIALFFFLLSVDLDTDLNDSQAFFSLAGQLLYTSGVSILIGSVIGWLLRYLLRNTDSGFRHTIITQAGCFLSYYLATSFLDASGVLALLPTALILLHYMQNNDKADCQFTRAVWDYKRYLASGVLHLMMGLSLTFTLFREQWLAMLFGVIAALLVRALIVYFIFPVARNLLTKEALDRRYCSVMWWGGMRGGTTIALAISLPEDLTGWWTIQAIAYGAVLFSASVQAASLPRVVRWASYKP